MELIQWREAADCVSAGGAEDTHTHTHTHTVEPVPVSDETKRRHPATKAEATRVLCPACMRGSADRHSLRGRHRHSLRGRLPAFEYDIISERRCTLAVCANDCRPRHPIGSRRECTPRAAPRAFAVAFVDPYLHLDDDTTPGWMRVEDLLRARVRDVARDIENVSVHFAPIRVRVVDRDDEEFTRQPYVCACVYRVGIGGVWERGPKKTARRGAGARGPGAAAAGSSGHPGARVGGRACACAAYVCGRGGVSVQQWLYPSTPCPPPLHTRHAHTQPMRSRPHTTHTTTLLPRSLPRSPSRARALSFSHSPPPPHTHTHALAPTLSWMGG